MHVEKQEFPLYVTCLTEKKLLERITDVLEQHCIYNSFSSPSPDKITISAALLKTNRSFLQPVPACEKNM